jgi:hypothetical protein
MLTLGNNNRNGRSGKRQVPNKNQQRKNIAKRLTSMNSDMSVIGLRPLSDNRTITCDFRYQTAISATAGGLVSAVFSLRNPTRAVNGSGTYDDVSGIANVFDQYKVTDWCLEYTPIPAINSFSFPPLYLAADFDDEDTTPLTTYAQVNGYNNRLIWDTRYANAFKVKIPEITSGLDAEGGPCVIHKDGFMDFQNPPLNGVVFAVGTGYPASLLLGQLSLTMRMVLKYQR